MGWAQTKPYGDTIILATTRNNMVIDTTPVTTYSAGSVICPAGITIKAAYVDVKVGGFWSRSGNPINYINTNSNILARIGATTANCLALTAADKPLYCRTDETMPGFTFHGRSDVKAAFTPGGETYIDIEYPEALDNDIFISEIQGIARIIAY